MSDYAPISSPNTGATIGAQITPQTLWQKGFEKFEENGDFWSPAEGASPSSIIMTKTDLSVGAGQSMKIKVESGFYDEPHYGDSTFATDDDFEALKSDDYDLTVDLVRHATSFTERSEEKNGIRDEIKNGLPEKMGNWLGRLKTENLDMMFALQTPSDNVFNPPNRTRATIAAADGLSWNYVANSAEALKTMGGQVGRVGKFTDGTPSLGLTLVTSSVAASILRQESGYREILRNSGVRGPSNPIFKGETSMVDGVMIVGRDIIDHDGEGAIGSVLNPRARLGTAIAAGTTAIDITGGGNSTAGAITKKKYFKYFDGYAYQFATGTTFSPVTETRYLLIINPDNAATDPGKIGMYAYTTGNNGNKITITQRLGSAASGVRATTVGSVVWNTGIWADKHTDVHAAGSLIIPCNAKGEPLGRSFLVARAAALRGYGKFRGKRDTEIADGGVLQRTYIRSYFGQCLRQDRLGRVPGLAVLNHALHYPNLPLPTVV